MAKQQTAGLAEYWQQQITAWQASGQSQKVFCEAKDLNFHRFGYWRRKLMHSGNHEKQKESGFVPVTVRSQPAPTALFIQLPNGLVLKGIDRDNLELVYQLLSRLS